MVRLVVEGEERHVEVEFEVVDKGSMVKLFH